MLYVVTLSKAAKLTKQFRVNVLVSRLYLVRSGVILVNHKVGNS